MGKHAVNEWVYQFGLFIRRILQLGADNNVNQILILVYIIAKFETGC